MIRKAKQWQTVWIVSTALTLLPSAVLAQDQVQRESQTEAQCVQQKVLSASDQMSVGELRADCREIRQLDMATPITAAQEKIAADDDSPVVQRLRADQESADNPFDIAAYRRNYVLPGTYSNNPNRDIWNQVHPEQPINNWEVKFQLSLQALIGRGILGAELWAGYTQVSWWQLYAEQSAPFRETNYEPEATLRWHIDASGLGFNSRALSLGFNHQSNGQSGELSRSWNRIVASAVFDRGQFALVPRLWWRIPEDEPDDDNPDIEAYIGHGDINLAYKWDNQLFSTTIMNNLRSDTNRTSIQLDWTFPVSDRFRGNVQFYHGYGESLIDYNHRINRLGIGILLSDWM